MAFLEKQLIVKKSTIPDSGKGLFTTQFIKKGTRIIEYKGRITTWKDVKHNDGANGYIYYVTRNHVIDAHTYRMSLARYANDARGLKKITGISNNAIYVQEDRRVFIEASKDIPAHSEILVAYGKEYWEAIRYNKKLEIQKKTRSGLNGKHSIPVKEIR
ncbi:MAG: SET domain-containing protein [Chitinophagaceae bacterium]